MPYDPSKPISPENPLQDPRYPGVTYLGDWGPTHPWHPVDMSQVSTPMEYVRQVQQMGEWASAQDQQRAAEVAKDPNSFIVSQGILQPKPSWIARNGPKIALFGTAALLTAGIGDAFFGGGAAAGSGAGAAGGGSVGAAGGAAGGTAAGAGGAVGAGAAGAAGGAVANSTGDFIKKVAGNSAPDWIRAAIAGLAGIPALIGANKGPSDEEKALYQQALKMQQMQQRRIEYQNPLFDAVTQLAFSRLPTPYGGPNYPGGQG